MQKRHESSKSAWIPFRSKAMLSISGRETSVSASNISGASAAPRRELLEMIEVLQHNRRSQLSLGSM